LRLPLVLLAPLALAACSDNADEPVDAAVSLEETTTAQAGADAQGNRWFYKPATQTALFGPANSEGIVSLSCNLSLDEDDAVVAFQWLSAAQQGARETVTVTSGDRVAEFSVTGTASALGPDAIWNGEIAAEDPALAFLAASSEPLTFTLGSESVTTPADEAIDRVVTACS
tara:strand:+ start:9158 stop:9670 length:513 start_codon:yes stop_codon:yes gene_type:complete